MSDYDARVVSNGTTKRQHFDGTAATPLVEVRFRMPAADAERIAADFDPSRDASPSATDSRDIARPIVEALVAAGMGGS